jgi:hypothetical protein
LDLHRQRPLSDFPDNARDCAKHRRLPIENRVLLIAAVASPRLGPQEPAQPACHFDVLHIGVLLSKSAEDAATAPKSEMAA